MIIITRRKPVILLFFLILFVSAVFSIRNENVSVVFSEKKTKCIILDAGHGFPDGGAVGTTGTIECTLNLSIAKQVESLLIKKGYSVIMTRTDENSLINETLPIGKKKQKDMHKRLEIINCSEADFFVSIHMNKFSDSRYRGPQVIYSGKFAESGTLAQLIQQELNKLSDNPSKRTQLEAPSSIFLLKNAVIPAIIVECGFLSNPEEEMLLQKMEHQKKISEAIANGIDRFYKEEIKE